MKSLYFLVFVASMASATKLFKVLEESPQLSECKFGVKSCQKIEVDFDALRNAPELELSNGMIVKRKQVIETGKDYTSVAFGDESKELSGMFAFSNSNNDWVVGDMNDAKNNHQYTLEVCTEGKSCFVWMEMDHKIWGETEGHGLHSDVILTNDSYTLNREQIEHVRQGGSDTTTVAEVTVTIYTTVEFRAYYQNDPIKIREYCETAVAETTQGYQNSGVPMKMKLHCIVDSDFKDSDYSDMGAMLDAFSSYHGQDYKTIRKDADMAVMITNLHDYCGIAYFNVIGNGRTLGVCSRGCAVGYYTFGHETGHMFGLTHNKEISNNYAYPQGYGYLMKPPENSGVRTNMAYAAPNHDTKLNYYSNPNIKYNGIPTGDATTNNAGVLTQNRFLMAAVGKESMSCSSTAPPGTTTPATTTPATTPTTSVCPKSWLKDGFCDDVCNNAENQFDSGDCCNNPNPNYKAYCRTCECKQGAGK